MGMGLVHTADKVDVSAAFLDSRKAVSRPGLGCTPIPPGASEAVVRAKPFHAAPSGGCKLKPDFFPAHGCTPNPAKSSEVVPTWCERLFQSKRHPRSTAVIQSSSIQGSRPAGPDPLLPHTHLSPAATM